jgi:23S rRNA (adenine2030-N6)-methyltransferase
MLAARPLATDPVLVLSYQHAYHAGNHADVLKHVVLLSTLAQLTAKPTPLRYVETHAGAGTYDLRSAAAQKNREYEGGIGRLWNERGGPGVPLAVSRLVDLVARHNGSPKTLGRYPGSPWLACELLRAGDDAYLFELHPAEHGALAQRLGAPERTGSGVPRESSGSPREKTGAPPDKIGVPPKNIRVLRENGLSGSIGLVPPPTRRALVLIDPSYETEREETAVLDALVKMHRRFSTGVYAVWYPIVTRRAVQGFERAALATRIAPIERYELSVAPEGRGRGLTGSVMLVVNPPWKLREEMEAALPWLARLLGRDGRGAYRIE